MDNQQVIQLFFYVSGGGWVGVLVFCFGVYRLTNGRMTRLEESAIKRVDCHLAQASIKEDVSNRIGDMQTHVDQRFDDLKQFFGEHHGQNTTIS